MPHSRTHFQHFRLRPLLHVLVQGRMEVNGGTATPDWTTTSYQFSRGKHEDGG